MKSSNWLLAAVSLLMLTGMRDPFVQPEDRCHGAELAQWRFQGMVSRGARKIGLMQDSQQRWRRVEQDQALDNGWTITRITDDTLSVNTGKACDPPQWQWRRHRQGEVDEAMDSGGADRHAASGSGRKSTQRDAGGG